MLLIRRFEEKVEERFRAGELPGFLHVAIGQEAVAVGVCRALEEGDIIASTHRAHGHTLAKGTTPNELMAELYGKLEGCSHGYGGSMHLYDIERGNMGANAVVGGGLPAITGAALAFKLRGDPQVYRSKEELEETRATQDPIEHLRTKLELSSDEVEEIDREVQEIVTGAVEFAKNGTDPKPEDALKNVYA